MTQQVHTQPVVTTTSSTTSRPTTAPRPIMVVTHSAAGGEVSRTLIVVAVVSGVLVLMVVASIVCVSCVAPLLSVIIIVFGVTTVVMDGCGVDVKQFFVKLHFILATLSLFPLILHTSIVKLVCVGQSSSQHVIVKFTSSRALPLQLLTGEQFQQLVP